MVENKNRLRQAIRNIKHFLGADTVNKKTSAKKKVSA
jgi:hypothetical protein